MGGSLGGLNPQAVGSDVISMYTMLELSQIVGHPASVGELFGLDIGGRIPQYWKW